jgi:hypothetical protein
MLTIQQATSTSSLMEFTAHPKCEEVAKSG